MLFGRNIPDNYSTKLSHPMKQHWKEVKTIVVGCVNIERYVKVNLIGYAYVYVCLLKNRVLYVYRVHRRVNLVDDKVWKYASNQFIRLNILKTCN